MPVTKQGSAEVSGGYCDPADVCLQTRHQIQSCLLIAIEDPTVCSTQSPSRIFTFTLPLLMLQNQWRRGFPFTSISKTFSCCCFSGSLSLFSVISDLTGRQFCMLFEKGMSNTALASKTLLGFWFSIEKCCRGFPKGLACKKVDVLHAKIKHFNCSNVPIRLSEAIV